MRSLNIFIYNFLVPNRCSPILILIWKIFPHYRSQNATFPHSPTLDFEVKKRKKSNLSTPFLTDFVSSDCSPWFLSELHCFLVSPTIHFFQLRAHKICESRCVGCEILAINFAAVSWRFFVIAIFFLCGFRRLVQLRYNYTHCVRNHCPAYLCNYFYLCPPLNNRRRAGGRHGGARQQNLHKKNASLVDFVRFNNAVLAVPAEACAFTLH